MSKAAAQRVVQCYHCRKRFDVSSKAESVNCPGCNQRVIVGDVIVKELRPVQRVQTCGRIVVHEKARVNAELVEAHEGIEMLGGLSARVISGGPVIIGPHARWNGDCHAPSLKIQLGARIEGGVFHVPDDSLGLSDLPGREGAPAPEPKLAPAPAAAATAPGFGGKPAVAPASSKPAAAAAANTAREAESRQRRAARPKR
jgi:DNA-directed RNA polymerase subunit RPC12/RpoP